MTTAKNIFLFFIINPLLSEFVNEIFYCEIQPNEHPSEYGKQYKDVEPIDFKPTVNGGREGIVQEL